MSGLLGAPYGNGCWEQARPPSAGARGEEREREKVRKNPRRALSRSAGARRPAFSRSLAPTEISPTTFRRRGCAPRFGEDLVINHDAAISQSNVRSLAGRRRVGGRRVPYERATKGRRRTRSGTQESKRGTERERERERGGGVGGWPSLNYFRAN